MPRKLKTAKKNRTTYRYYNADGSLAVELRPGEDGVTEADIGLLHTIDDGEVDAERREEYHAPVHIDAYGGDGRDFADAAADLNPYLADESLDPQKVFDAREAEHAQGERLARLSSLIESLSPEQLELYEALYGKRLSGRQFAASESVTEGAIRKRKNRLLEELRKKF
jgi:hypothetical protein